MVENFVYIFLGLGFLVWSADWFVEGSAVTAKHLGMPPLLIGMLIVGFGTSAPEMMVSALSAANGTPGIALGNAYGSNICNIALILGAAALMNPISVQSGVLKKELPILTLVTAIAFVQMMDGYITRMEAGMLVFAFCLFLIWSLLQQQKTAADSFEVAVENKLETPALSLKKAVLRLTVGLVVLIFSSRVLVTGAVHIAASLGISDLMIGLTIVAAGTSLPELASTVAAARRNEHDLALGNIIGSNLFNTLIVVGIAGLISPAKADPAIFSRDMPVMAVLTVSIFLMGYGFKARPGRINRAEGFILLLSYICYMAWLVISQAKAV